MNSVVQPCSPRSFMTRRSRDCFYLFYSPDCSMNHCLLALKWRSGCWFGGCWILFVSTVLDFLYSLLCWIHLFVVGLEFVCLYCAGSPLFSAALDSSVLCWTGFPLSSLAGFDRSLPCWSSSASAVLDFLCSRPFWTAVSLCWGRCWSRWIEHCPTRLGARCVYSQFIGEWRPVKLYALPRPELISTPQLN